MFLFALNPNLIFFFFLFVEDQCDLWPELCFITFNPYTHQRRMFPHKKKKYHKESFPALEWSKYNEKEISFFPHVVFWLKSLLSKLPHSSLQIKSPRLWMRVETCSRREHGAKPLAQNNPPNTEISASPRKTLLKMEMSRSKKIIKRLSPDSFN